MVMPFLQLLFDKTKLVTVMPAFSWSVSYLTGYFNYWFSQALLLYGKQGALWRVCIFVAFVFLLKNLFRFLAAYFMAFIRNGIVRDVRVELFGKMMRLPLAYFSGERKGDLTVRLTTDVQEIEQSIISVIETSIREPLTIICYLGAMVFISPTLSLIVLLVLPITGVVIGRIGRSLKRRSHQAQAHFSILMSMIDESLSGLRIIKGFGAENSQTKHFERENQTYTNLMTSILRQRELASPLSEFLSISVVSLLLYIGGVMVLNNTAGLSADTFIGFMLIFSQLIPPAKALSTAFFQVQKGIASIERIESVLQVPIGIEDAPNAVDCRFEKAIEYKNVSFAYHKEANNNAEQPRAILNTISLYIPKGKVVALVGASGAGKTTLADLLPRFYDVTSGDILIDGVSIKQLKLQSLRQLMGIVSQEAILFNDTVRQNIAFGMDNNVNQAQIEEAARIANAHDFIMRLENGYDTIIGDRGSKLSGGEKQRLTIARAVLKNPPILILDEATSALDTESERAVQDALTRLMQNRTTIVIAHRLSTIKAADEIVVMERGYIVERGTHNELMQKNGIYSKLIRS